MAIIVRDATTSTQEAAVDVNGNIKVSLTGTGALPSVVNTQDKADGATGATAPTEAIEEGLIAVTSLPTAVANGQLVGGMGDKFGRAVILPQAPRDLISPVSVQTTNNSSTPLIAAGGAGVFLDLAFFMATNESASATIMSVSDGTNTYKVAIAANGGAVMPLPVPIPATSANTGWTVTGSTNTINVDCIAIFVKNK